VNNTGTKKGSNMK